MKRELLIFRFILIVLVVALLSGCSPKNAKKSWVGQHKNELIHSLGQPSKIVPDGKGGEILIYSAVREHENPGEAYPDGQGDVVLTPPHEYKILESRRFYVDSTGIIDSIRQKDFPIR